MDILRIPIKFGKAVSRLSPEEQGYILSSLFAMGEGLDFEIKDDSSGDLLSLIIFECEKMDKWANVGAKQGHHGNKGAEYGSLGGRPRITPQKGDSNNPPRVPPKGNSNSKITNNIIHSYYDDEKNKDTLVWCWLDYCIKLGYTPAKEETIETLDEFIGKVFLENKVNIDTVKGVDSGKSAIYRWYTHWKEDGTPIKNFKSKFSNTIQYSIK